MLDATKVLARSLARKTKRTRRTGSQDGSRQLIIIAITSSDTARIRKHVRYNSSLVDNVAPLTQVLLKGAAGKHGSKVGAILDLPRRQVLIKAERTRKDRVEFYCLDDIPATDILIEVFRVRKGGRQRHGRQGIPIIQRLIERGCSKEHVGKVRYKAHVPGIERAVESLAAKKGG